MKTILFVSHDANRAGAQIVLLQIMKQLKQRGVSMHLLLGGGGALEAEFEALVPIIKLPQTPTYFFGNKVDNVLKFFRILAFVQKKTAEKQATDFKRAIADAQIDLIFLNTVAASTLFEHIKYLQKPVILFAHELAMSVDMYADATQFANTLKCTNRLLVVAQALAEYYEQKHFFPKENISIFTLIDTQEILIKIENARKNNIRATFGIPSNAVVVGGCGNAELRKGNDLFLMLARSVLKKYPHNVYFMWVGLPKNSEIYAIQTFDIERMGLADRIILVEPTPDVFDFTTEFDVFALTSREDPYPMVALEAALNQTPVVCFEKSGGLPDLVETDAGAVVPYLDVEAMSAVVQNWIENPETRKKLGNKAKEKVIQRHDTQQSVDNLCAILQSVSGTEKNS